MKYKGFSRWLRLFLCAGAILKIRRFYILLVLLLLTAVAFVGRRWVRRYVVAGIQIMKGQKTVSQRVDEYGQTVRERLKEDFERVGVDYPPDRVTLIGLKREKLLEVWVADDDEGFLLLKSYPILRSSGRSGPKLKEGDYQVPEGIYQIEWLNPNSKFHLSLRLNYPNAFDRKMAKQEGRTDLGGDIMIHGGRVSVGCLAMGDLAVEDLFVLAAETGLDNMKVILSPWDFRIDDSVDQKEDLPDWVDELYEQIKMELRRFARD